MHRATGGREPPSEHAIRVLIAHSFFHARGGDSTYARTLEKGLVRAGHEVAWLSMRHPANDPSPWERWFVPWRDLRDLRGVRATSSAALRYVWDLRSQRFAADLIDKFKPDVLHLQHVHRHLTPSIVEPARKAGVPVVWTTHDYELICPAGTLWTRHAPCERCRGHRYEQAVWNRCKRGSTALSALAAVEKRAHQALGLWDHVDRFLCPSRFLAEKLVAFGVPASRVTALPNGYDAPPFEPSPGEGWLFAGRLSEEKGVHTLIDAARQVDTPLDVCGDGAFRDAILTVPGVRFHGHLSPLALEQRLRRAAVVVVPSVWWENLPYAVIEAQALGRAVVASRTGGIPELVEHGVDGLLVPPGDGRALADAVKQLLGDPSLRRRLGAAASARVRERHDLDHHVARVSAEYGKCIGPAVL